MNVSFVNVLMNVRKEFTVFYLKELHINVIDIVVILIIVILVYHNVLVLI